MRVAGMHVDVSVHVELLSSLPCIFHETSKSNNQDDLSKTIH